MFQHDLPARQTKALRRFNEWKSFQPKHFRSHIIAHTDPVEQRIADDQQPEARPIDGAHQNDDIQKRQCTPDFDKSLPRNVHPSTEIALHAADQRAERERADDQYQSKTQARPQAIENPRQNVTTGIVQPHHMGGRRRAFSDAAHRPERIANFFNLKAQFVCNTIDFNRFRRNLLSFPKRFQILCDLLTQFFRQFGVGITMAKRFVPIFIIR